MFGSRSVLFETVHLKNLSVSFTLILHRMNVTELSRIYEKGNDLHLTFSRQEDARLDSVVRLWEEYQNELKIIGNSDQQINDLWNFVRFNDSKYGMQKEQALTVLGAICGCVTAKSANEILLTANSPFVSLPMNFFALTFHDFYFCFS